MEPQSERLPKAYSAYAKPIPETFRSHVTDQRGQSFHHQHVPMTAMLPTTAISIPIVYTDTRATRDNSPYKGSLISFPAVMSPLAFCVPVLSPFSRSGTRLRRVTSLVSNPIRLQPTNQSRLSPLMSSSDPTGKGKKNKNNLDGSWLDKLLKKARESYTNFPHSQQFYVQLLYLTVVISGALYMGATLVRIYTVMRHGFEFSL